MLHQIFIYFITDLFFQSENADSVSLHFYERGLQHENSQHPRENRTGHAERDKQDEIRSQWP